MEDASEEDLSALVEYQREDACELLIPEFNINPLLSASGKLNQRSSFALCWKVPTDEDGRGNIISLRHFVISISNEGCFTVQLQAMQPHGFETDPTSIAGWTSVMAESVLHSEKGRTARVIPTNNNFVVPHRLESEGGDYIHLLSFSAARQLLTVAGNELPSGVAQRKSEVALRIKIRAIYTSSGNDIKTGNNFMVRLFQDDTHMSQVASAPAVPFFIGTLGARSGNMALAFEQVAAKEVDDETAQGGPIRAFLIGQPTPNGRDYTIPGLKEGKCYQMPFPVNVQKTGLVYYTTGTNTVGNGVDEALGRFLVYCYGGAFKDCKVSNRITDGPWQKRHNWDIQAGWYLCHNNVPYITITGRTPQPDDLGFCWNGGYKGQVVSKNIPRLLSADQLVGARTFRPMVNCRSSHRPTFKAGMVVHHHLQLCGSSWADRIISGITFVVKIIKTAAIIASAVGLMDGEEVKAGDEREEASFVKV